MMDKPRLANKPKTKKAARLVTFPIAAILMIVGGALWAAGELIGVFDPGPGDTTTEFVLSVNRRTHGVSNIIVWGLLAWATLHFAGVA